MQPDAVFFTFRREESEGRVTPTVIDALFRDEIFDTVDVIARAEHHLCCLHNRLVTGTTAVVRKIDASVLVEGRCFRNVADAPEVQAVGQADEVRGEAITSYVGALPCLFRSRLRQRLRNLGPQPTATSVVHRMGADQIDGTVVLGAPGGANAGSHRREIYVQDLPDVGDLEPQ